jgi:hypothetical protein
VASGSSAAGIAVTFSGLSFSAPTGTIVRLTVSCAIGGLPLPQVLTVTLTVRGCPAGYRTVGSSGDDCAVCPAGTWPAGTGATCSQCPSPGLLCGGESAALRLQRGYVAVQGIDTLARLFSLGVTAVAARQLSANATDAAPTLGAASQLAFAPCVPPDACMVAADGHTVYCDAARGYAGPFCAGCADGWTRAGQDCLRCPEAAGLVLLVLLALAVSGLGAWLSVDGGGAKLRLSQLARLLLMRLRQCRSEAGELHGSHTVANGSTKTDDGTTTSDSLSPPCGQDVDVLAAIAGHLSTLALLLQLGPVPLVYRLALQIVSIPLVPFGLLALLDLPALQCLPGWTLFAKGILASVTGLSITAFLCCLRRGWFVRTRCRLRCARDGVSSLPTEGGPMSADLLSGEARCSSGAWQLVATSAWPTLCAMVGRLMSCTPAIENARYVLADPVLQCGTPQHTAVVLLCVFAMAALLLGGATLRQVHRGSSTVTPTAGLRGPRLRVLASAGWACARRSTNLICVVFGARPVFLAALSVVAAIPARTATAAALRASFALALAFTWLLAECCLLLCWHGRTSISAAESTSAPPAPAAPHTSAANGTPNGPGTVDPPLTESRRSRVSMIALSGAVSQSSPGASVRPPAHTVTATLRRPLYKAPDQSLAQAPSKLLWVSQAILLATTALQSVCAAAEVARAHPLIDATAEHPSTVAALSAMADQGSAWREGAGVGLVVLQACFLMVACAFFRGCCGLSRRQLFW